jgi:hypothetical protein
MLTVRVPGARFNMFLHNAQSSIGVFTIFQATKASEYDLNAKSLNYLVALAKHACLEAIAIRYIAVIPAGHEIIMMIKWPIAWRDKLGMYATPVANYLEPQLMPGTTNWVKGRNIKMSWK